MDDIEVVIRASITQLQEGMAAATAAVSEATTAIGEKIEAMAATTAEASEAVVASVGLMEGAFLALAAYEGIKAVVDASTEAERALALVESQIRATGGAAGFTAQQMLNYADSLEQATTFSHTEIEELEAKLMAFTNVTGEQFTKAIQVILDFSSVTGRDASMAVKTLGVALNDPAEGMGRLKQAGIDLSETQQENIKQMQEQGDLTGAQNALLYALTKSYGGAAEAMRDTFGGALTGLKHQLEDDIEGGPGSFNGAKDAVNQLSETLKDPAVISGIQAIIAAIADLVGWLAKAVSNIGGLVEAFHRLEAADLNAAIQRHTKDLEAMAAAGQQATQAYQDLYKLLQSEVNQQLGDKGGTPPPPAAPGAVKPPAGRPSLALPDIQDATPQMMMAGAAPGAMEQSLTYVQKQTEAIQAGQRAWQGWMSTEGQANENAQKDADIYAKGWVSSLQQVGKAFEENFMKMAAGHETLQQAIRKTAATMLSDMLQTTEEIAVHWIAKEALQTAATAAGTETRAGMALTAAATAQAGDIEAATTGILANAWKAAAAVYASVADIPFVGWILAPGLALGAGYEVASWVGRLSSAEGGWGQIPSDQLAMVHKNEMVLPAAIASPMRQALAGDGGLGGGDTHFHISAMDSRSVDEMLRRNMGPLVGALKRAKRMGHG